MKTALIIGALLALSGCSLVFQKAGPQLSKAVNKYCATVSEQERGLLRSQVNAAITPNSACVHCAGDQNDRECVAQ